MENQERCDDRAICTRCMEPIPTDERIYWESESGDPMHEDCLKAFLNLKMAQEYGVGQPRNYDGSPKED